MVITYHVTFAYVSILLKNGLKAIHELEYKCDYIDYIDE